MDVAARAVALTGSDQAVSAVPTVYRGFTLRETAGAVATVRLYDNASAASGTLIDSVALAAGESRSIWLASGGILTTAGLYVKIVAGAVEGSVRVG